MKKSLLYAVAAVLAFTAAAQKPDTLRGRNENYYYPTWYDQCRYYNDNPHPFVLGGDTVVHFVDWSGNTSWVWENGDSLAVKVDVPRCMLVAGVAVMTVDSADGAEYRSLSDYRGIEYVMIMDGEGTPGNVRAAARWDTAAPRTMVMSQDRRRAEAGGGFGDLEFTLYEAYFDSPVMVDSSFYMAGTFNSNHLVRDGWPFLFETKPTFYGMVRNIYPGECERCIPETRLFRYNTEYESRWLEFGSMLEFCGPFIPIPAMVSLTAQSDSLPLGTVDGSGTFRSGDSTVIRATAATDCRFVCWNDGDATNPRVVHLCGDATYTAYFVNDSTHTVKVKSNDTTWGIADGSGIYHHGSHISIGATPMPGYEFTEWADGDTNNPRWVDILSDTVFTAIFDPLPLKIEKADQPETSRLAFKVSPNPAHDRITITANKEDRYTLRIYDGRGRMVMEQRFDGTTAYVDVRSLRSGIYLVALQSAEQPETKTLIKL